MRISDTAHRLQEAMDSLHYRQVDVIEKAQPVCEKYGIKLSKVDLSQYIKGKNAPSQDKLTVLAEVLDVNEPWLMGYDLPKESKRLREKAKKDEQLVKVEIKEDGELIVKVKLDQEQNKMNILLNKLNKEGKKEAFKRVEELSFIPRFISKEEK